MSAAFLGGAATRVALCLRLVRRDGIALGFTTHDRALSVDGLRYEPHGMAPSALVQAIGTEGDSWEVVVPLAIRGAADDMTWIEAAASLWATDWHAPGAERVDLGAGHVTGIRLEDTGVVLVVRDAMAALDGGMAPACSPTCRAELGDEACGVNMAVRQLRVLACAVDGGVEVQADVPFGMFVHGRLRVRTGAAAGWTSEVVGAEGMLLRLRDPLAAAGTFEADLQEGCDRRFATCASRFGNAANFRGEPHVPGIDALVRRG